jgi:malate synthase
MALRIDSVTIGAVITEAYAEVLTPEALAFVVSLQRTFNKSRIKLLARRTERQLRLDAGEKPDFLSDTRLIRESEWVLHRYPPIYWTDAWKSQGQ